MAMAGSGLPVTCRYTPAASSCTMLRGVGSGHTAGGAGAAGCRGDDCGKHVETDRQGALQHSCTPLTHAGAVRLELSVGVPHNDGLSERGEGRQRTASKQDVPARAGAAASSCSLCCMDDQKPLLSHASALAALPGRHPGARTASRCSFSSVSTSAEHSPTPAASAPSATARTNLTRPCGRAATDQGGSSGLVSSFCGWRRRWRRAAGPGIELARACSNRIAGSTAMRVNSSGVRHSP